MKNIVSRKIKIVSLLTALAISINLLSSGNEITTQANDDNTMVGDLNSDNSINIVDSLAFKKELIADSISSTSETIDIDGNGVIDYNDLYYLQAYLLRRTDIFPSLIKVDSDEDGIYDYVETNITLTDPAKSDTDNDGISDYDEIAYLRSDPTVYDTLGSGLSDADEDFDDDGISNVSELLNNTNPLQSDSDYDGLSDYDEIYTYTTNPNSYDSDDDGLSDYDELQLSLDPNNSATNTVNDSEYIVAQQISKDSQMLQNINNKTEYISLSINISSAGLAESGLLTVTESEYVNLYNTDYIVSTPVTVSYNSSYNLESAQLNFEISEQLFSDESTSLEDYAVFKYFDDSNLILPVKTEYNYETNTISTTSDQLGTYFVCNIPDWLESIGVKESEQQDIVMSPYTVTLEPVNVAFVIDGSSSFGGENKEAIINDIRKTSKAILANAPGSKISICQYTSLGYSYFTGTDDEQWATDTDSLEIMLNFIENLSESSTSSNDIFNALNLLGSESFWPNSNERIAFVLVDSTSMLNPNMSYTYQLYLSASNTYYEIINSADTTLNFVTQSSYKSSYATSISYLTRFAGYFGGTTMYRDNSDFSGDYYKTIYDLLHEITISDVAAYWGWVSMFTENGTVNTTIDSDGDGLPDFAEISNIDSELAIKLNEDGTISTIPTYGDAEEVYEEVDLSVITGDEEMHHPIVVNTPVKPFNSYENNPDSDSDKIIDSKDSEPEVYCQNVSDCIFYNTYDPNFDGAEYYSKYVEGYVNEDVTRHATVLALETDEEGNGHVCYACENCNKTFKTPEEQDKELLTPSEYALVTALENLYFSYSVIGETANAESVHRVIDSIRLEVAGSYYEYQSNGRYISPVEYTYPESELSYVSISMWQYTEFDIFWKEINTLTVNLGINIMLEFLEDIANFITKKEHKLSWVGDTVDHIAPIKHTITGEHSELQRDALYLLNDYLVDSYLGASFSKDISVIISCYFYVQDVKDTEELFNILQFPNYMYRINIDIENNPIHDIYKFGYAFNSVYEDMYYQTCASQTDQDGFTTTDSCGKFMISQYEVNDLRLTTNTLRSMIG